MKTIIISIIFIAFSINIFSQKQQKKITLLNKDVFSSNSIKNIQEAITYLSYSTNFDTSTYWVIYPDDTNCIKLTIPENSIWNIGYSTNKSILDTVGCSRTLFTDTNLYYTKNINSCFDLYIKKPTWAWYLCLNQILLNLGFRYDTDSLYDGFSLFIKYNNGTWVNLCQNTYPDYLAPSFPIYDNNDTILGGIPAFYGHNYNNPGCCIRGDWTFLHYFMFWDNSHAFEIDSLAFRFCFNSDNVNRNHEGVQIDFISINLTDACNVEIKENMILTPNIQVIPNPIISESLILNNNNFEYFEIYNSIGTLIKRFKYDVNKNVIKRDWFCTNGIYILKSYSKNNYTTTKLIVN